MGKRLARSRASDTDAARVGPVTRRIRDLVRRYVYRPDPQIGWYPFAVQAGRAILRESRFDAIFSSSFPITAHLVARRLHRVTRECPGSPSFAIRGLTRLKQQAPAGPRASVWNGHCWRPPVASSCHPPRLGRSVPAEVPAPTRCRCHYEWLRPNRPPRRRSRKWFRADAHSDLSTRIDRTSLPCGWHWRSFSAVARSKRPRCGLSAICTPAC